VCALETERDRNLFASPDFIINVDTKWSTHATLTEDPSVRATWRGADWVDGLYLLAISRSPAMRSLRDLRGVEGAALCESMRDELRRVAREVYGVSAGSLRIFFHYHPQASLVTTVTVTATSLPRHCHVDNPSSTSTRSSTAYTRTVSGRSTSTRQ